MHLAVRTIDFDYPLPEALIADRPLPDRSASRMMVIHRATGMIEHRHFCDFPEYCLLYTSRCVEETDQRTQESIHVFGLAVVRVKGYENVVLFSQTARCFRQNNGAKGGICLLYTSRCV